MLFCGIGKLMCDFDYSAGIADGTYKCCSHMHKIFEIGVSNSYLAVDVHIDNSSPFSSQYESDRFFMLESFVF